MAKRLFREVKELKKALAGFREEGRTVVLANGCFDIIHVGHIRYLCEAATYGDMLIVAVNDDESTRALKGEGRPVVPDGERAELLLALRCVDYVLLFGEQTVDRIIRELRPDFHAKGTDYTVATVPELETASEVGCRTVITGDPKDHSSREMIERLRGGG